jgi:hypothetical protein
LLQERDEILAEPAPTSIKVIFVRNKGVRESCLLVGVKGLEPRIEITASELL